MGPLALAFALMASRPKPPPDVLPKPAPAVYASRNYGLTFRTVPGSTYCPLPDGWVGSDHGTVLFLAPSRICSGSGYASSSRGFLPNARRIEIYYGYWLGEDEPPPPSCHRIGSVELLGKAQALCRGRRHGQITASAKSLYPSVDETGDVVITLVTDQTHLKADLDAYRTLVTSVSTCSEQWSGKDKTGKLKRFKNGQGPACPASATWF